MPRRRSLTAHHRHGLPPDGEHTFFYSLGRLADGSWRIVGGGTGP